MNGKPTAAPVPAVLPSVPPPSLPPPPHPVSSSFTRLDAASTDIKHEPKSPLPPDSVGGPSIGLNLTGSGGVDSTAAGGGFGEASMACNGHAPRYGGLVTPGAPSDVAARCLTGIGAPLMDDDSTSTEGQPPAKRLHFADANGWSP